jgi:hypothetical protein
MIPAATADRIMIHTSAQNEFLALKRRLEWLVTYESKTCQRRTQKLPFSPRSFYIRFPKITLQMRSYLSFVPKDR